MKMAKMTIELELDNAAFDYEPNAEVARILRYLTDTFQETLVITPRGPEPMAVRDINGNTIGHVTITS